MRWLLVILLFSSFYLVSQEITTILTPGKANPSVASKIVIDTIKIEGNKITRDNIILREVEFKKGDSLKLSQLDSLVVKSSQNLLNRSLFNFVTISKEIDGSNCDIKVKVVERWYIWPIPILDFADRNFNVWWETRDFSRLDYGIDLRVENFRGRMEFLNLIIQAGYDKKFQVEWTIPYLTKNQVFGMSVLGGFQLNKEIPYALEKNKPVFINPDNGNAQEWAFGLVDFTFRQKFNFLHSISLSYDHLRFTESLLADSIDGFDYDQTVADYFSLGYLYKQDFRDYKPYPLKGYYFDAGILKQGFGIFKNGVDVLSVSFVFDQYINIYKRWYFAYNLTAKLSNKSDVPYFIRPGFGYKGTELRGYEYYIITGQHLGMLKSNLKFEIIPRKVHRFKWIKTEKFGKIFYALYANLFFDMGYAYNKISDVDNALSNQLLWGTGLGIDFVTYYDLVIRFEYTINRQRDHGFYINLVAPI